MFLSIVEKAVFLMDNHSDDSPPPGEGLTFKRSAILIWSVGLVTLSCMCATALFFAVFVR